MRELLSSITDAASYLDLQICSKSSMESKHGLELMKGYEAEI